MIQTPVKISGMACSMCEAHINDTIRRTFSVEKVSSSHKATSPENFLITKATRLFTVGWLSAYDVKSTNLNFLRSKA